MISLSQQDEVADRAKRIAELYDEENLRLKEISDILVGRSGKCISKTFNGMPYGRSKPALTGHTLKVMGVSAQRGTVFLSVQGMKGEYYQGMIGLYEMEFSW